MNLKRPKKLCPKINKWTADWPKQLNKQDINALSLDARLYLHRLGMDFKQLKLEEYFKAAGFL